MRNADVARIGEAGLVLADEITRLRALLAEVLGVLERADHAVLTAHECACEHEPAGTTKARDITRRSHAEVRAIAERIRKESA